jgi:hypothetical protein
MYLRITSAYLILVAALGFSLAKGQVASGNGPEPEQRSLAVNFIRAINTAEMANRGHSHEFTGWTDISVSAEFKNLLTRLSRREPQLKSANLSSPDEILPGWRLRLTLSEDHKSYVVMLINTSDQCSYAVVSDQEGIIREATAIGCPSSRGSAASTQR